MLERTVLYSRQERELVANILHHMLEIERRKLYSSLGLPSLFAYTVETLGYSEAEAYRRICAMRAMVEIPEIEEKISSGAISLTNIALAQTVFRREEKITGKSVPRKEKMELLQSLEGKTTRQAEKIVLGGGAAPQTLMADRMRLVGDTAVEIKFAANQELVQKIAQLRGLLAHSDPHISLGELVEKLCDLGIQSWSPQYAPPKKQRAHETTAKTIPGRIYDSVWQRDQGRCVKCKSTYMLEVDHIQPRALGGSHELSNLRLLCRPCNQRAAINVFGLDMIEQTIEQKIERRNEPFAANRPAAETNSS